MLDRSWNLLGSHEIRDYKVFKVREDRYRFEPSGLEADFLVCDSEDWVVILPITTGNEVVFVRQYRHGVRQVVLETPGGIMDPQESPSETAARELREETGYEAARIEIAGSIIPNPALNNARCHIAVATGCELTGETDFDPLERIETELHPLDGVSDMIRNGELSHAQAIAGFTLARTHGLLPV